VSVAATPHGLTRKSGWRRSKVRIDSSWKSPRRTGPRAIPEQRSNTVDVAQSFRIVSTSQKSVFADRIHLNHCRQGESLIEPGATARQNLQPRVKPCATPPA
jgi:hypothetical protein